MPPFQYIVGKLENEKRFAPWSVLLIVLCPAKIFSGTPQVARYGDNYAGPVLKWSTVI